MSTICRFLRSSLPLVFGAILLPGLAAAQSGLAFLRIGPDAQGMALGDAGVASASGAFGLERNPASLSRGSTMSLGLTHHQWIAGVSTYGMAGRFNTGSKSGVGIHVRATGSGDLAVRDQPGPASGTFDAQFVSVGGGAARSFGAVSLGVAAKYLSERIFTVSATGYAADFGATVDLKRGSVKLGAALLNLGSMEELVDRSTELPTTVRVGAAVQPFRVLSFDDGATLLDAVLTVEYSQNTADETSQLHVGAAASVLETVRLRVGYLSNDALRDVSAGLGVEAGAFRLDYALLPFEQGFGGPGHVFTLVFTGQDS